MVNYIDKDIFLNLVLEHQYKIYEKYYNEYEYFIDDKEIVDRFFEKYNLDKKFIPYYALEKKQKKQFGISLMEKELASMLNILARNIAHKRNYRSNQEKEDMVQAGTLILMKTVKSFDLSYSIKHNKSPNAYGYFTQICDRAFSKFCDNQNEKLSKYLDYVLEEDVVSKSSMESDEEMTYKNTISYFRDIRNSYRGKWSKKEMMKREKEKINSAITQEKIAVKPLRGLL